jgi:hypothetical protein
MPPSLRAASLRENQLEAATEVIARFFSEQPYAALFENDPERRLKRYCDGFAPAVKYCLAHGDPYVTIAGGKINGVALWMPPHSGEPEPEEEHEFGLDNLVEAFGEAFAQFRPVEKLMREARRREMGEPHWFLPILAFSLSEPADDIVKALMEPVFIRADEGRLPCYVQTTMSQYLELYRNLGFEVLSDGVEAMPGAPLWTFCRRPQAE